MSPKLNTEFSEQQLRMRNIIANRQNCKNTLEEDAVLARKLYESTKVTFGVPNQKRVISEEEESYQMLRSKLKDVLEHIQNTIHNKRDPLMESSEKQHTGVKELLEDRGNRYGKFSSHAALTQELKDVFVKHVYKIHSLGSSEDFNKQFPAYMIEALDMIFHKIGRIGNGDPFYIDSWKDLVGYSQLVVDELSVTEGATDGRVVKQRVVNGKLVDELHNTKPKD